jgi:acetyl/propionyl-CoA carboxylase alpha subunit
VKESKTTKAVLSAEPKLRPIKKILIANRGEIALRVINTCREMGIKVVAIGARDESLSAHFLLADEAVCLNPKKENAGQDSQAEIDQTELKHTYLNGALIVKIALEHGCDAIHPGYGFLSENADFARKVEEAGMIFLGPTSEVVRLMGDKKVSKEIVLELGVPVIPGYQGGDQGSELLEREAHKIGFPVLIKAVMGGGGKGQRIVYPQDQGRFKELLAEAKSEGLRSFLDDRVLIEKYIQNPRHIEVQVLSDQWGHHLHLGDRDCSIQRRNQKIVEECPAPGLSDETRAHMRRDAVKIASSIGYQGVGTLEFLFDADAQQYYFLEMNTRLQVEHCVTEMVTGLDLVRQQIAVGEGRKLSFTQEEVTFRGHSIEVRLYAEDPDRGFMPTAGWIETRGELRHPHLRLEMCYGDGDEVSTNYDPMIGKLVAWGETRDIAATRLCFGLDDIVCTGFKNNIRFLQRILSSSAFRTKPILTHFLKTHGSELQALGAIAEDELALAVGVMLWNEAQGQGRGEAKGHGPQIEGRTAVSWQALAGIPQF